MLLVLAICVLFLPKFNEPSSARSHWDHPYNNVRHQIANTLATLLAMDIPIMGAPGGTESVDWNVGRGFPTIRAFVDQIIPCLSLNIHNPEFSGSGSREDSPGPVDVTVRGRLPPADSSSAGGGEESTTTTTASGRGSSSQQDTPNTSSEDVSMVSLEPEDGAAVPLEQENEITVVLDPEDGPGGVSEETKRANRILETVSLWICHQIR